jgi:twinkle protein
MSASEAAARQLRSIVLDVAKACLPHGVVEGDEFVAGNIQGAAGRSLRVRVFGDPDRIGVWADFAGDPQHRGDLRDLIRFCLADGDRALALAKASEFLGGHLPEPAPDSSSTTKAERPRRSTTEIARSLWRATLPFCGTVGEVYLVGRDIDPAVAGTLRFLPNALHSPTGRRCPALIAPVRTVGHRFVGIHRIFLEPDGRQLQHPDPKLSLGDIRGGHIPLSAPREGDTVRHIAEGIEDGLAILTVAHGSWVDAVSASTHLYHLPTDPRAALTFVHHDADEAGRAGAEAFKAGNGDDPDIILTPPAEKDLNRLLQVGGREAVLRHLAFFDSDL